MSIIEAFFLGFLQGVTEFLPISSSGHLTIANHFLGSSSQDNLLILLLFHLATALSIMVVFAKEIWQLLSNFFSDFLKFEWNESTQYVCKLAISAIPIFIVGVFFEEQIEVFFEGSLTLVALMLLVTAVLLFLSSRQKETNQEISYVKSFWIGVFQAFAILPGLSRSGVTITTAILLGCGRQKATKFSFLMLLAPVLGGSFLQLLKFLSDDNPVIVTPLNSLLVGFVTAFLIGLVCCWWMRKLVQKNQLVYFSFYCVALALVLFSLRYVF